MRFGSQVEINGTAAMATPTRICTPMNGNICLDTFTTGALLIPQATNMLGANGGVAIPRQSKNTIKQAN